MTDLNGPEILTTIDCTCALVRDEKSHYPASGGSAPPNPAWLEGACGWERGRSVGGCPSRMALYPAAPGDGSMPR